MSKHSVSMVIIPPTVIALIGATSVGIFIAASAAAMGVRAWWIDGIMGFGVALAIVFGLAFLLWLNFLYPQPKPAIVHEKSVTALPNFTPEEGGRVLVRDPIESISFEKAVEVARYALKYNAPISFRGMSDILTDVQISHLQTELKVKQMAIEKPNGGIELVKKGTEKLSQYLLPTNSYKEYERATSAYTHGMAHTD